MKPNTHNPILTRLRLILAAFPLLALTGSAATVTGSLADISIQALNTKILFAPTNDVLVTPSGLSAGPPKLIQTSGGQFSINLEAGDYTVSVPLIPWRRPFVISVMNTNAAINITNLMANPHTYTYTNNLNYTVKATANDAGPDFLDAKLAVAGSLAKLLVTNSGVVSVVLSNPGPLHLNSARVIAWSTNGETSLLDSTVTLRAGTLHAGSMLVFDVFGTFSDPAVNVPTAAFNLKLGSTVVVTEAQPVGNTHWHLHGAITLRSAGATGQAAGAFSLVQDYLSVDQFGADTQTATIDTTAPLAVALTANIANFTDAETVVCEQLLIELK